MNNLAKKLCAFVLTIAAITWLIGCGETKQKDTAQELFAKAQELRQGEKYDDAIRTYRKIARDHKDSRLASNSQFMIGYIYANHLKDLEQAKNEINRFLEKYSEIADSGLIVGAKFELEYLGKDIEDIPILSTVGQADSTIDADRKDEVE